MHPPILGAGRGPRRILSRAAARVGALALLVPGWAPAAAPKPLPGLAANCPMAATALVEHFVAADCPDCWGAQPSTPDKPATPGAAAVGATDWSLDWVVPSAAGEDAPLASSELPEAVDRLQRLGPHLDARLAAQPAALDTSTDLAPRDPRRRMYVHSSLPHEGYFGVQMHARGVWPTGSTGWISLVELVPAGSNGSEVARHVVRAVVGPVALPAGPGKKDAVAPLYALRWPAGSFPDRITATAWIEGRDGRILQIATDRCRDPT